MNKLKFLVGGLILLFLIAWFGSPFWVLYQINQAIEKNQADEISKYIDYTSVKASLKPQVKSIIEKQLMSNEQLPQWQHAVEAISEKLSDRAVDLVVNPQSIVLLMQGKALKESVDFSQIFSKSSAKPSHIFAELSEFIPHRSFAKDEESGDDTETQTDLTENEKDAIPKSTRASYRSFNRFEVRIPNQAGHVTTVEMQRDGLSWNIVAIKLPQTN